MIEVVMVNSESIVLDSRLTEKEVLEGMQDRVFLKVYDNVGNLHNIRVAQVSDVIVSGATLEESDKAVDMSGLVRM